MEIREKIKIEKAKASGDSMTIGRESKIAEDRIKGERESLIEKEFLKGGIIPNHVLAEHPELARSLQKDFPKQFSQMREAYLQQQREKTLRKSKLEKFIREKVHQYRKVENDKIANSQKTEGREHVSDHPAIDKSEMPKNQMTPVPENPKMDLEQIKKQNEEVDTLTKDLSDEDLAEVRKWDEKIRDFGSESKGIKTAAECFIRSMVSEII